MRHQDMEAGQHVMACMEVWGGNRAIDNGVMMPGLDAWVFSLPYMSKGPEDGGGDIHYVTSCATGRITRLIVADVSGHGAPVAQAAEALRRLMRKHTNYIDQTRLVEAVNREFGVIAEGASESGVMFATAVVATYFSPTDELTISNAGHPRPMWYDAKRREWRRIESDEGAKGAGPTNLPLGILEGTLYPAATFRLRPDDLVLFYTDSLIEAKGEDGRMLGHEGLRLILGEMDASRPETLVRELLARIAKGDADKMAEALNDDVTALLVRRNALKPRPSIGLSVLAGWRIIREAAKSLTKGALPSSWPDLSVRSIGGAMVQRLNGSKNKAPDAP